MVRIDYDEAVREADRLGQTAWKCRENNNHIDRLISEISHYWQGEAAQELIEKLNQWKQENSAISLEAEGLGRTIHNVANEIRQAEIRTIQAINSAKKGK